MVAQKQASGQQVTVPGKKACIECTPSRTGPTAPPSTIQSHHHIPVARPLTPETALVEPPQGSSSTSEPSKPVVIPGKHKRLGRSKKARKPTSSSRGNHQKVCPSSSSQRRLVESVAAPWNTLPIDPCLCENLNAIRSAIKTGPLPTSCYVYTYVPYCLHTLPTYIAHHPTCAFSQRSKSSYD